MENNQHVIIVAKTSRVGGARKNAIAFTDAGGIPPGN
jgi:hypothetical protein